MADLQARVAELELENTELRASLGALERIHRAPDDTELEKDMLELEENIWQMFLRATDGEVGKVLFRAMLRSFFSMQYAIRKDSNKEATND